MPKFLKSALAKKQAKLREVAAVDEEFTARCPAVSEFLTCCLGADGKPRLTSTVSLFAQDGVWKLVLNEREESLSLWVSADTLEGLWDALEQALTAPEVPWRSLEGKRNGKR